MARWREFFGLFEFSALTVSRGLYITNRRDTTYYGLVLSGLFSVQFNSALDNTFTLTYHYSVQFNSVKLFYTEENRPYVGV